MTKQKLIQKFINGENGKNHNANSDCLREPHTTTYNLWLCSTKIVQIQNATSTNPKIIFSTGGWETRTTKNYMNLVLKTLKSKWKIQQKEWEWFFVNKSKRVAFEKVFYINLKNDVLVY